MLLKKPFIPVVLSIGVLLFAGFTIYLLLPLLMDSRLIVAIGEVIAIVFCLMILFFVAIHFMLKKGYQDGAKPDSIVFDMPGTIAKLPAKEAEPSSTGMSMTG